MCALAVCCLASMLTTHVHAGVVIDSTRVIYPAQQREITVKLTNQDEKSPLLVQAWIDDGNEKSTPDQLHVPFILTPPVFRIDPGKGQALRVTYLKDNDKPLPTDKESMFWLNVLEVPPKPKAVNGQQPNTLQLAFRTRIKLFFRPKGLKGNPTDAPGQLRWKLVADGAQPTLVAENPSVYYVSFESVSLVVDGKDIKSESPQMIAPGGTQRYPLKDFHSTNGAKSEVHFNSIDDYGQFVSRTAMLTP
ncbi:fimbria/pilus periplasmic chaperone [Dyella humi]|uniref:Fimbria/pilus periplasmic chaperone n=2 Tax=Dyella humi TaxID=1770547 RepID=A0ABW8IFM6_9GAMM